MAQTEEKPRGAGGKFISESDASNITEEDIPGLISKSSKMTGALKDIKEEKEERELEKPLVSLSINNPVSWLMKVVNKLKKKQTTTFTFRLGIPLIALPIFIAAFAGLFFGLGKITTKEGSGSYHMSRAGILKVVNTNDSNTSYLVLPSGEAIKLEITGEINLENLNGKRILVSGTYEEKGSVIKVQNVTDMELLPESPKPMPTPVETPTEKPTNVPTSVPLPQKEDIVRSFFRLTDEGKIPEAISMLSSKLTGDDTEKQTWGVMLNAFEKIEVKSIENAGKNIFKVTLDIEMKPGSENVTPIPYYGYGNGEFVRWIGLTKEGGLWKISDIATGP
jgi:hypothetical protein